MLYPRLYENLPGGQTREGCENKPEELCPEIPPEDDPCLQLLDSNKFGQVRIITYIYIVF